ncbi:MULTISPECIES: ISL3 family transposase [Staphylococcus]|nr:MULTISPECIES: ISL3 family transposase [Staphylococcus]AVO00978.1 ISL3 family transposase [Staphylococcus simulans]AVO01279.1 ISL3 family transposase [Staphylococcus simulans]AVO01449.1 ISL3 family transposase [Staphylococcus simulans]AVO01840.1 ISL3 family transposase [Staphylococcus simulans]AVO01878.1 ISL3 family transposase [Staphylococcus simulans]
MSNTISITLGIKDKNITFEDKVEERKYKGKNSLFYFGKLIHSPKRCKLCGHENTNFSIIKNGLKKSCLTIPKVSEKPAYLILEKQRFHCKKCCSYFTAETPVVERNCYISQNTRLAVLNKSIDIRSQKSVAESCHVSNSTVTRIINKAASQIAQTPFKYLPEHLMMDEFKSVKNVVGKMSFIYADAVTHRIIDIVPDRRLFALKNYFYRYPLSERKRVKTVSIDMYEPYMALIREVFPNAKILIDRFHIVQSLNRALNMTRVTVMNSFRTTERPLYNKYKRYWKILLKPYEQLEAFVYSKMPLYKQWKTPKGVVEHLLSFDERLLNTHTVVNELRSTLKENNKAAFETALKNIEINSVAPKLQTAVKTLRKHNSMIRNTFEYSNLTNGPLEGINTKIKLIQRISFGYRNFGNLRSRIILCTNLFAANPKKEIKQLYAA